MTPNRGQWDERILYNVDLNQGKLYLENTQMTFNLSDALSHNHSEHEDGNDDFVDDDAVNITVMMIMIMVMRLMMMGIVMIKL